MSKVTYPKALHESEDFAVLTKQAEADFEPPELLATKYEIQRIPFRYSSTHNRLPKRISSSPVSPKRHFEAPKRLPLRQKGIFKGPPNERVVDERFQGSNTILSKPQYHPNEQYLPTSRQSPKESDIVRLSILEKSESLLRSLRESRWPARMANPPSNIVVRDRHGWEHP